MAGSLCRALSVESPQGWLLGDEEEEADHIRYYHCHHLLSDGDREAHFTAEKTEAQKLTCVRPCSWEGAVQRGKPSGFPKP